VDLREERILENERAFEAINRRLKTDLQRVDEDERQPVAFVCECGHTECHESVMLTIGEWERTHAEASEFVVLPGHEIPDVEDTLAANERFLHIRKHQV